MANWLLMIGSVIVTAVYNNTTSLGNAYGVCVIFVTFITTCMVALVAILVWRLPFYVVLPVFLIFTGLDGAYLSSVLTKVPDGAWFTLMLAVILSLIFTLWRFGKEAQWKAESLDRLPASAVLTPSTEHLTPSFGGTPVSTVPGLGIFFDKKGDAAYLPQSFAQFVRKFAARPSVLVFFHMRSLPLPTVESGARYVITRVTGMPSTYAVVLRHGYMDDVLRSGLARELITEIELVLSHRAEANSGELETLRAAESAQMVYVLGKEVMRINHGRGVYGAVRRVLLNIFLWIRENSRTKLADMDMDVDRLIEVGFVKEI